MKSFAFLFVCFFMLSLGSQAFADEKVMSELIETISVDGYRDIRPNAAIESELQLLNEQVTSTADIVTFRKYDDLNTTTNLSILAADESRSIRIKATLIMAQSVDNTTVCAVIDRLIVDDSMSPEGRSNLLQVVRTVSQYATLEVRDLIYKAIATNKIRITSEKEQEISYQIIQYLTANRTNNLSLRTDVEGAEAAYQSCMQLKGIQSLSSN